MPPILQDLAPTGPDGVGTVWVVTMLVIAGGAVVAFARRLGRRKP